MSILLARLLLVEGFIHYASHLNSGKALRKTFGLFAHVQQRLLQPFAPLPGRGEVGGRGVQLVVVLSQAELQVVPPLLRLLQLLHQRGEGVKDIGNIRSGNDRCAVTAT